MQLRGQESKTKVNADIDRTRSLVPPLKNGLLKQPVFFLNNHLQAVCMGVRWIWHNCFCDLL